jgi:predicted DCC family thiol-disulfide oxidoreductase YuxK
MVSQGHRRDFEVFYDGECPICRREIAWFQKLDRGQNLRFTDIADPKFDAPAIGKTHPELMAEIHGRFPNGSIISGMEVFRQLYAAVGFTRLVSFSRWPVVRNALDAGYWCFAKLRTRLPRSRCSDETCLVRVPTQLNHRPGDSL